MAPAVAGGDPHPDAGCFESGTETVTPGQVTFGQAVFGQASFGEMVFGPEVFGPEVFGRVVAFGRAPFGETVGNAVHAGRGYAVGAPVLAGGR